MVVATKMPAEMRKTTIGFKRELYIFILLKAFLDSPTSFSASHLAGDQCFREANSCIQDLSRLIQ